MSDSNSSGSTCQCGWQAFMAFLSGILAILLAFVGYEIYQADNHPARFWSRTVFDWFTTGW